MTDALTEPQRRALAFLAEREWGTPAGIGYAMTVDRSHPLKPQGAGRIGGTMAWRLMKRGLVSDASRRHSGFSAYAITRAGRAALKDTYDRMMQPGIVVEQHYRAEAAKHGFEIVSKETADETRKRLANVPGDL